jgi:phage protein D
MNTTEKTREWADVTDGTAANTIFGEYGFTPDPTNLDDDSPTHASSDATLMQRASDAAFLRTQARRNGKLFRVFCRDSPGQRTGFFAKPNLDAEPVATLILNDAAAANIDSVDVTWDVMRPSAVIARQALFTDSDPDGAGDTTSDDSLNSLASRGLSAFAGNTVTALLTTTAADAATLTERATSLLRESGWFVRCEGTTEAARLGAILRVGTIVELSAAGALHSGNYLVWSVRHHITAEKHEMNFTLVRNAVGAAPSQGRKLAL